ncbi:MAG: hypothetical protein FJX68_17890 [Alphaproteobacteria bacterium]|nr:hypothetical protein [Alphaproteobacteria bacterium]
MAGAELPMANLRGADLRQSDLRRADLRGARLAAANLDETDLTAANFGGMRLVGRFNTEGTADLSRASLRSAKLSGAHLRRANLQSAILAQADLREADLSDAKLCDADLTGADLHGATLTGTDLRGPSACGSEALDPPLFDGVAGHHGLAVDMKPRTLAAAASVGMRAAGMEGAAGRRVDRAWHLARDRGSPAAAHLQVGQRIQQQPRIGMSRPAEQRLHRRHFDQLAEIHDPHPVGDVIDDRQVVADEQVGQAKLALKVAHQVQDLRLH